MHLKCPARCVTAGHTAIKLSKKLHNHEPHFNADRTAFASADGTLHQADGDDTNFDYSFDDFVLMDECW